MKDVLISLYEQNEQYHTAKENMFWFSITAYLAFSGAIVSWLLSTEISLHINWLISLPILIFISIVFSIYFLFSFRQNWLKGLSAIQSGKYLELISKLDNSKSVNHATIVNYSRCRERIDRLPWCILSLRFRKNKIRRRRRKWDYLRKLKRRKWTLYRMYGSPGRLIMKLTIAFFVAQAAVLVYRFLDW